MVRRMDIENIILNKIKDCLKIDCNIEQFIFIPQNPNYGDISCKIPFHIAKEINGNAKEIAEKIVSSANSIDIFEKVEALNGYINFYYEYKNLCDILLPLINEEYGKCNIGNGKKVLIEHTSVNPNKALHIGHVRNACIGDSIARILKFCGYNVQTANYIDDTGTQVADIIVGFYFLNYPKEVDMKFDQYCGDKIYVEVNKMYEKNKDLIEKRKFIMKKIEEGNNEISKLAEETVDKVLKAQYETLFKLNIFHDIQNKESDILKYKFWEIAFNQLKEKNYLIYEEEGKNKGCWVLNISNFDKFKNLKNPNEVLVRSDGTILYAGKDIAYAMWKHGLLNADFNYKPFLIKPNGEILWTTCSKDEGIEHPEFGKCDISINVIDVRQSYEQEIVKYALQIISEDKKEYIHKAYEVVSLSKETAKQLGINIDKKIVHMSGRKGLYVNADKILDLLIKKAYEETKKRNKNESEEWIKRVSEKIAISALRFELTKVDPNKIIVFDIDEALKIEYKTGPYLLYTYARAKSILSKAKEWEYESIDNLNIYEKNIIKKLIEFPRIVKASARNLLPSLICNYLNNLALSFNLFYEKIPVLKAKNEEKNFRLTLIEKTAIVLKNGLNLIGIETLERM